LKRPTDRFGWVVKISFDDKSDKAIINKGIVKKNQTQKEILHSYILTLMHMVLELQQEVITNKDVSVMTLTSLHGGSFEVDEEMSF
jgi:hypothetical protein